MNLRTSKVLKVLAMVMFMLGLLAPVFFFAPCSAQCLSKFSCTQKKLANQNPLMSYYAEESGMEEREDATGKQVTLITDQLTVESLLTLAHVDLVQPSAFIQHGRPPYTPVLFKLHCRYLI